MATQLKVEEGAPSIEVAVEKDVHGAVMLLSVTVKNVGNVPVPPTQPMEPSSKRRIVDGGCLPIRLSQCN